MYNFLNSFKPNDGTKWQKILNDFHDNSSKIQRCYLTFDSVDVYIHTWILLSLPKFHIIVRKFSPNKYRSFSYWTFFGADHWFFIKLKLN